jgi:hypothetical protein
MLALLLGHVGTRAGPANDNVLYHAQIWGGRKLLAGRWRSSLNFRPSEHGSCTILTREEGSYEPPYRRNRSPAWVLNV